MIKDVVKEIVKRDLYLKYASLFGQSEEKVDWGDKLLKALLYGSATYGLTYGGYKLLDAITGTKTPPGMDQLASLISSGAIVGSTLASRNNSPSVVVSGIPIGFLLGSAIRRAF